MNKTLKLLVSVAGAALLSSCATTDQREGGATVEVNYQEPERFTDMTRDFPAGRRADEGYMAELRRHIEQTGARYFPAGSTLAITITDVDMAGDFEPQRGPNFNDIRLVKPIYPPRISLSYRLTDANGAVISEGERRLHDQAFEWRLTPLNRDDPLRYEKALIDDFLRDLAKEV